jgi:hypothetical protein
MTKRAGLVKLQACSAYYQVTSTYANYCIVRPSIPNE